jgi:hypothetical protein
MKITQLVAAVVLRAGVEGFTPVSWMNLGKLFSLTQDQCRHRLTNFKKKYNVVDADGKNPKWAREFLAEHADDSEKVELSAMRFYPGEVVKTDGDQVIIFGYGDDQYQGYYPDGSHDDLLLEELTGDVAEVSVELSEAALEIATAPSASVAAPQFIVTPMCLIVVRDGKPLTIDKSHKNFDKIKLALDAQQWTLVYDLIDLKSAINKYSNGRVKVENGSVHFDGKKMHGKLAERLTSSLIEDNVDSLAALSNFMVKCDDNPDARVLSRLFSFMSAKDIRIDKDGDFYAYKVVRSNYLDKHSGTMKNEPGMTVSMKRNQVNPIDSETCSTGLHVCSKSYISSFGGGGDRIVLCKVHPKDVVSVPTDYGDAKMRTCSYVVIKDVTENFVGAELPGVAPK